MKPTDDATHQDVGSELENRVARLEAEVQRLSNYIAKLQSGANKLLKEYRSK